MEEDQSQEPCKINVRVGQISFFPRVVTRKFLQLLLLELLLGTKATTPLVHATVITEPFIRLL